MNRIKELRKEANLSQKQLSEMLNIADSTLSYWENGRYEPDQKGLFALSQIFDVSIDYLLGRSSNPDTKAAGPKPVIPPSIQEAVLGFHRKEGDFTDDELAQIETFFQVLEARRGQKKGV